MRPTWAEVSLSALCHNYKTIQQYVAPNATVCAVMKADAYGHGAVACAQALEAEGATWFAVSSVDEGVQLREGGIRGRILLLSGFFRGDEEAVILHDLTPAVWEWWHVELLEDAAARLDRRVLESVPIHLKLNTGMNRVGMDLKNLPAFLEAIQSAEHLIVEGAFSHFASAEIYDGPNIENQLMKFNDAMMTIRSSGISPVYYHIANSSGIVSRDGAWMNMVR